MRFRKALDIRWSDLVVGALRSVFPGRRRRISERVASRFSEPALCCLSVRTALDAYFTVKKFPPGTEVLVSALTVDSVVQVLRAHHLVPVPLDIDLETLGPNPAEVEARIGPRTKVLLVAHLFGARIDLDALAVLAEKHQLELIEDSAQHFVGADQCGHSGAVLTLFSFGPIKTASALGGAAMVVRDPLLRQRIQALLKSYAELPRRWYFKRILKFAGGRLLAYRIPCAIFIKCLRLLTRDYDRIISQMGRSFSGSGFLQRIRKKAPIALLYVLDRRLRSFTSEQQTARTKRGWWLREAMGGELTIPGRSCLEETFWLTPVLLSEPEACRKALYDLGFDATQGLSLVVVDPPPGRLESVPTKVRGALEQMLFVPVHHDMNLKEVECLAEALLCYGTPQHQHRVKPSKSKGVAQRQINPASSGLVGSVV